MTLIFDLDGSAQGLCFLWNILN